MSSLPHTPVLTGKGGVNAVEISLNAAVISVDHDAPCLLMVRRRDAAGDHLGLPAGPFVPSSHVSLEAGVRDWVMKQAGVDLGYLEQLYTFGDHMTDEPGASLAPPQVTLGYMALTTPDEHMKTATRQWVGAYDVMPWEDWRDGRPEVLTDEIEPKLKTAMAKRLSDDVDGSASAEAEAMRIAFGFDGAHWDEERALERFEILQHAGLMDLPAYTAAPKHDAKYPTISFSQVSHAHRRILAAALGRLRAKIKYRPVLFELMAPEFTLYELQRTVEAILGSRLHKQNFRRLVESGGLVDPTADIRTHTGGRPAKLFRFRREVMMERSAPGVRVRSGLAA